MKQTNDRLMVWSRKRKFMQKAETSGFDSIFHWCDFDSLAVVGFGVCWDKETVLKCLRECSKDLTDHWHTCDR